MSNFDHCNNHHFPSSLESEDAHRLTSPDTLDNLKRDRFELLSAYLDGEVSADERRQVETWLASDTTCQRLYARLIKIRQGLKELPVPVSEQPVEQVAEQVMFRLERRPRRTAVWGGVIAALFVGAVVGTLPRTEVTPSVAQSPENSYPSANAIAPAEGLMIALDRPVIEIPKAAVSESN